jgi:hypothetical protein
MVFELRGHKESYFRIRSIGGSCALVLLWFGYEVFPQKAHLLQTCLPADWHLGGIGV